MTSTSSPTTSPLHLTPRTPTGLIPTSHKSAIDRAKSPDMWTRLPPRPPPVLYPYRGDRVAAARKSAVHSRDSRPRYDQQISSNPKSPFSSPSSGLGPPIRVSSPPQHGIENTKPKATRQSSLERKSSVSSKRREHKQKKKAWDSYVQADRSLYQLSPKEAELRSKIRDESKQYLEMLSIERHERAKRMPKAVASQGRDVKDIANGGSSDKEIPQEPSITMEKRRSKAILDIGRESLQNNDAADLTDPVIDAEKQSNKETRSKLEKCDGLVAFDAYGPRIDSPTKAKQEQWAMQGVTGRQQVSTPCDEASNSEQRKVRETTQSAEYAVESVKSELQNQACPLSLQQDKDGEAVRSIRYLDWISTSMTKSRLPEAKSRSVNHRSKSVQTLEQQRHSKIEGANATPFKETSDTNKKKSDGVPQNDEESMSSGHGVAFGVNTNLDRPHGEIKIAPQLLSEDEDASLQPQNARRTKPCPDLEQLPSEHISYLSRGHAKKETISSTLPTISICSGSTDDWKLLP